MCVTIFACISQYQSINRLLTQQQRKSYRKLNSPVVHRLLSQSVDVVNKTALKDSEIRQAMTALFIFSF